LNRAGFILNPETTSQVLQLQVRPLNILTPSSKPHKPASWT
jgi:hypothetical protein